MFRYLLVVLALCCFGCNHQAEKKMVDMTVTSAHSYRQPIKNDYEYMYLLNGVIADGRHVVCTIDGFDGRFVHAGEKIRFLMDDIHDNASYAVRVPALDYEIIVLVRFIGEDMDSGPVRGR